jgi:hypothetical protein
VSVCAPRHILFRSIKAQKQPCKSFMHIHIHIDFHLYISAPKHKKKHQQLSPADVEAMGFTELRDALLDIAPLDTKHVSA